MQRDSHSRSKDLLHSLLLGPVRSLGPAGLNVLLYPILIAHGGLAGVGVLGAINLVLGVFAIGDLGISQFVGRAIARGDRDRHELAAIIAMTCATWAAVTAMVAAAAYLLRTPLSAIIGYPAMGTAALAVVLVFSTGGLSLVYGLLSYVLVGAHLVSPAQVNDLKASVVQFVVAVGLLQITDPFLALALAFMAAYLVRVAGLYRIVRHHNVLPPLRFVLPHPSRFARLLKQSSGFALVQMAQYAQVTVYRAIILGIGGPAILGLFEAASRVPFLLEQAISNGLQAFFSIFSSADWGSSEGIARARRLMSWAHKVLLVTSVGALGAWIALAGPIIGIWLNIDDPMLVTATKLFGFYNLVRAMNVLSFWALQARGGEARLGLLNGILVGVTAIALILADKFAHTSFAGLAAIIAGIGCVNEILIALLAQARTGLLTVMLGSWRRVAPYAGALFLALVAFTIGSGPMLRQAALIPALRDGLLYGAVWLAVAVVASRARPLSLLKPPPC
jgi:hypothetical protein